MSTVVVPELKEELDCLDNCSWNEHGRDVCIIASAAKGISAIPLWLKKCANYAQVQDDFGRTVLHLVASTGNIEALEWLVKRAGGNIDKKDRISGHTPLHRSIYYGQIHIARSLINFNADLHLKDNEGMTAFELCNADCPREFRVNIMSDPTELYVWGSNDNYTLGSTIQQTRPIPEQLELFRKNNTRIMETVISTYHSVFLSQLGEIFVCGSSRHGRLGLGHDKSVLQPESLPIRSTAKCVSIATGIDHTLFLMENGRVLSCGSNEFGMCGQKENVTQSLVPKTVEIPGKVNIEGILATRYHSVFYTPNKIFTCGLNRGQLGHSQENGPFIYEPKLVSQITWDPEGETHFTHVAASTAATVARANTGIIYLLYKFDCIKINAKQFDVIKLKVSGGSFGENLAEKCGKTPTINDEHLVIVLLTSTGRLIVWRYQANAQSSSPGVFSRAIFNSGRVLNISDFCISQSSLLFVTNCGEAYKTVWKPTTDPTYIPNWQIRHQNNAQHSFNDFQISTGSRRTQKGKDASTTVGYLEFMKIHKIKNIYSALNISSDEQGKNFAIIQASPKTELTALPIVDSSEISFDLLKFFEETNEEDFIHDVVLQAGNRRFPVHLYIIASGCPKLHSIIVTRLKTIKSSSTNNSVQLVNVEDVSEQIFHQILQFTYSHTCDLLTNGKKVSVNQSQDIMKLLTESARRFDLQNLSKALKKFTIVNDEVRLKPFEPRFDIPPSRRFKRNVNEDLSDIMLQSLDLKFFKAHRCILVARSEYFYSMLFANVWLEHSSSKPIAMQFSGQCLEIFLEYIYEDSISNLPINDFDALSEILVMSDNLFMQRLRTLIESALADLLSVKNVVSMLYLADRCNAIQLKETCMQLICMNLPLVLDTRVLDPLPLDLVKDLSTYYCEFHPAIKSRSIKKYFNAPTEEEFEKGIDNISSELLNEIESSFRDDEIRKPIVRSGKSKLRLRSHKLSESEPQENFNHSANLCEDLLLSPSPTKLPPTPPAQLPHSTQTLFISSEKNPMLQPSKKLNIPNPSQTMKQLKNAEANEALKEKQKLNPSEFPSLCDIKVKLWNVQPPLKPTAAKQNEETPNGQHQEFTFTSLVSPLSTGNSNNISMPITNNVKSPNNTSGKKKRKWRNVDLNNQDLTQEPQEVLPPITNIVPSRDPQNPWKVEDTRKVVFREIVQDEVEKKENFQRAVTKPLNLMQIEDQAINQLTTRYHSADVEDGIEIVTVERISTTNYAPPTWVQHPSFNLNLSSQTSPKT